MHVPTLAVVGVGLIGGSVAAAARTRGVVGRVLGVDAAPAVLDRALARGLIDEGVPDLASAAARADLVVIGAPVDRIARLVLAAASHCRPGTLLTDVGSTKGNIVEALRGRLPVGVAFAGSHPLAGSEKQGPENADADLFQDRLVVLTPAGPDESVLTRLASFWQALGAKTRVLDAADHDRALALTSHLPHLLAYALAGILPADLRDLTATGFRDTTRLASSAPDLWAPIFLANSAALLDALDAVEDCLRQFRQALASSAGHDLLSLLLQGQRSREELSPQRQE